MAFYFVNPPLSLVRFRHPIKAIMVLRYADKRIVNKMQDKKVYIERNNLQLELIWYCWLYSRLFLWSGGFNAISPTEHLSVSFEHKPLQLSF